MPEKKSGYKQLSTGVRFSSSCSIPPMNKNVSAPVLFQQIHGRSSSDSRTPEHKRQKRLRPYGRFSALNYAGKYFLISASFTNSGTIPDTSPPRETTSLTLDDEMKVCSWLVISEMVSISGASFLFAKAIRNS